MVNTKKMVLVPFEEYKAGIKKSVLEAKSPEQSKPQPKKRRRKSAQQASKWIRLS